MKKLINTISVRSKSFHHLAREGMWVILGQVTTVVAAFLGVRLLTELLDPDAYGQLSLGLTIATLVHQIVFGPLGNGVARFYAIAIEGKEFNGYLRGVTRLVLLGTGFTIVLMLLIIFGLLFTGQANLIGISMAAFVFAILSGYASLLDGMQNAARQRAIVSFHQGIQSVLRFLFAAGLIVWFGPNSAVAMLGYAMGTLLVFGSQCIFFQKTQLKHKGSLMTQQNYQSSIWQYSYPFAAWGIFYWVQSASDRWALEFFANTREVGMYMVIFQLGYYPISMATGMVMQLLAPIFYERIGDASDSRRISNVNNLSLHLTWLCLLITGAIFLITLISHAQIFQVLVAAKYSAGSYLLPWILLGSGIFSAGQIIALNLMSQMNTKEMMKAKIITSVLGVGLNFIGAYWYGARGVVIAGILFSISYLVWMLILARKTTITLKLI